MTLASRATTREPTGVRSLGGLPNTQTLETVKLGLVYRRNPLLVQYLYDFHYAERIGQGVATMFATMREQGHPDPELTAGDSYCRVMLPARSVDLEVGTL